MRLLRTRVCALAVVLLIAGGVRAWADSGAVASERRAAAFERVRALVTRLPELASELIQPHLRRRRIETDRDTEIALVIETMRQTGMRIGNKRSTLRSPPTFGASTLRRHHVVKIGYRHVTLELRPGKSKQEEPWRVTLRGRDVARAFKAFVARAESDQSALFMEATDRLVNQALSPYGGWNHAFRKIRAHQLVGEYLESIGGANHRAPDDSALRDALGAAYEHARLGLHHDNVATTTGHYLDTAALQANPLSALRSYGVTIAKPSTVKLHHRALVNGLGQVKQRAAAAFKRLNPRRDHTRRSAATAP